MISRRDSAYSSITRRTSSESASLGGCSSLFGGVGRFMQRLSATNPKKPVELDQGLATGPPGAVAGPSLGTPKWIMTPNGLQAHNPNRVGFCQAPAALLSKDGLSAPSAGAVLFGGDEGRERPSTEPPYPCRSRGGGGH